MNKLIFSILLGIFLITLVSADQLNVLTTDGGWTTEGSTTTCNGINSTANLNFYIINVTKSATNTATKVYITYANGTSIYNGTFTGNLATMTSDVYIRSGERFNILTGADGVGIDSLYKSATNPQGSTSYFSTVARTSAPCDTLIPDLHQTGFTSNLISIGVKDYPTYSFLSYVTYYLPTNNSLININDTNFTANLKILGQTNNNSFTNATINIWFTNGTLFNQTTILGLSTNNTNISRKINNFIVGDYLWNVYSCYANATYSNCNYNSLNNTFSHGSAINSMTYDSSAYETDYSNYLLNISVSSGYTPTNAYLVYNGTSYSVTITNTGANNYTLSKLLSLDSTKIGLNTFYFKYNISSISQKLSSNYTQIVNNIQFSYCMDSNLTIPYLNLSFKDESTEVVINATIPTATFIYWLGDSTLNKTFTYSNTTLNYNYTFCFTPQNKTLYLKPTVQYNNPSYTQRTYEPSTLTLTNNTNNVTLYLLSTADGLYVTFQVANLAGQTISGVDVSGTRLIGSTTTTVASGTTGSDGGITFWLNYHYLHTFTFSKSGYETVTYTLTPTQSSYTVTMGSTTTTTSSYTRGITESIYPNQDFLDNETEYNFNYTIDSDYWSLELFGFKLYYQNGTLIGSDSSSDSNGGTVSVNNLNFSTNQTYVYMNYYYVVNGTQINGSRTFYLQDNYGRSFSIWQFFTDFKMYTDSGNLWGFDEFGKILLSVIVLIMVAGGASLRYGVSSDIFVAGIIFGVILMLDYGLGWFGTIHIGNNIAVSNLPTIVCAIAIIVIIIMEETR